MKGGVPVFTFHLSVCKMSLRFARPNVAMGITVGTRHAVSAKAKDDTMGGGGHGMPCPYLEE